MAQAWAIVEVRGGVAELDCSDDVEALHIDWDNIGDSFDFAAEILDLVHERWSTFPERNVTAIRDALFEVWPDLQARWNEMED